jgi:hypothetical protein
VIEQVALREKFKILNNISSGGKIAPELAYSDFNNGVLSAWMSVLHFTGVL